MKISMDKKYRIKNGPCIRILCVDRLWTWPILAMLEDGSLIAYDSEGCNPDYDDEYLVEVGPYDHLKIDDKVVVWSDEGSGAKYRRHFAGVNNEGLPKTFSFGNTSYTQSDTTVWDQCELYCPVLHKDI